MTATDDGGKSPTGGEERCDVLTEGRPILKEDPLYDSLTWYARKMIHIPLFIHLLYVDLTYCHPSACIVPKQDTHDIYHKLMNNVVFISIQFLSIIMMQ